MGEFPEVTGDSPLVSVVTVCLNSGRTIRRTIESVLAQTYSPIEYIIIDGVSTDGTLEIIRSFGSRISVLVSEKDRGISDAFSKGIGRAQGGFVQLLNADDWLPPEKIAASVKALKESPDAAYVYGDIVHFTEAGGEAMTIPGDRNYRDKITMTMPKLNHPTMLVRNSAYQRHGAFDPQWRVAMDYDWLLRLHKAGEHGVYSPDVRVNMSLGGVSDKYRMKAFREVRRISINHGLNPAVAWTYFGLRVGKNLLLKILGQR